MDKVGHMRLVLLVLSVSSSAFAEPVPFPKLSEKETKKLDANEIIVREIKPTDNKGVGAESMALVDAPPSEVWPVLRDCEHFQDFMPKTKKSAIVVENGDRICHIELKLPFPLTDLWSETKSVIREEPAGHYLRSWTLVRGTYHRNSGSWHVLPWGDGKKTLVVYTLDTDPKMIVPDALIRSAQTGSLPDVFHAIRKRVTSLREQ
jgi:ribosome-associated toxin RatA of RatAB toxin-antitoxin module